ncbi:MAG: sulfate ABC transporter substrate-binding protein [Terrimicrobiaceae bacterium]
MILPSPSALGIFFAVLGSALAAEPTTLLNVSYDVSREFYTSYNAAYAAHRAQAGLSPITIQQSHGGSSKQARAVIDGLEADVVTMNQDTDIDAIAAAGLIEKNWKSRLPDGSSPYVSTIVFLVRKGNPKGVKDWDDLVKSDVSVIIPNPLTSGNGRYSYLGAWAFAQERSPGQPSAPKEFVEALFKNVPLLEAGGRAATNTFVQKGIGDVLLTFESEVKQIQTTFDVGSFDVVYPPASILAEFPVSLVDAVVDRRGSRALANDYLQFLWSEPAQRLAAEQYLRPRNPTILAEFAPHFPTIRLVSVQAAFGTWGDAQKKHFSKDGTFEQIYQTTAR